MVAGVAIDDVEIVDFVEMVLGGVGGVNAADARIEAAAENGRQTSLFETLLVGPLPRIFEVRLVFRLIVGGVEIVASAGQTRFHNRQILIRQSEIDHQFGLVVVEKGLQLFHIVGIDLRGLDVHLVACLVDVFHDFVTLRLATACNHKVGKHVGILRNLKRSHCCDATGANH